MKRTDDSSFRYTPSYDTDVKKTFERIRRRQQRELDKATLATRNVAPINRKTASRGS